MRNTAVMSVGTALSRITGFLRLSVAAWALGTLGVADVYNRANTTPNILYELALGGILTSVFVPVFVEWMHTRGREEAWEVARRVLTLTLVVLGTIAVLGALAGAADHALLLRRLAGRSARADRSSGSTSCGGSCRRSCSTGSARSRADC